MMTGIGEIRFLFLYFRGRQNTVFALFIEKDSQITLLILEGSGIKITVLSDNDVILNAQTFGKVWLYYETTQ